MYCSGRRKSCCCSSSRSDSRVGSCQCHHIVIVIGCCCQDSSLLLGCLSLMMVVVGRGWGREPCLRLRDYPRPMDVIGVDKVLVVVMTCRSNPLCGRNSDPLRSSHGSRCSPISSWNQMDGGHVEEGGCPDLCLSHGSSPTEHLFLVVSNQENIKCYNRFNKKWINTFGSVDRRSVFEPPDSVGVE